MLAVQWIEDQEGCLVATWFDIDNVQRGEFVEAAMSADEYGAGDE